MNAKELRIGNYIRAKSDKVVETVCILDDRINCCSIGYYEGVPLTEEWLVKFGFKKAGLNYWVHKKFINFKLKSFYDGNEIIGFVFEYGGEGMSRVLKKVHKLKNAFWLTGEELEIK